MSKPAIIVKFKKQKQQSDSLERLNKLVGKLAESVEPVFPDDDSDDLGSLFEVRLQEEAASDKVVHDLEEVEDIEYAHKPSSRSSKR